MIPRFAPRRPRARAEVSEVKWLHLTGSEIPLKATSTNRKIYKNLEFAWHFNISGNLVQKIGSGKPVMRCLKSFLEVIHFSLTRHEHVRSHGDSVYINFYIYFSC